MHWYICTQSPTPAVRVTSAAPSITSSHASAASNHTPSVYSTPPRSIGSQSATPKRIGKLASTPVRAHAPVMPAPSSGDDVNPTVSNDMSRSNPMVAEVASDLVRAFVMRGSQSRNFENLPAHTQRHLSPLATRVAAVPSHAAVTPLTTQIWRDPNGNLPFELPTAKVLRVVWWFLFWTNTLNRC